MDQPLTEPQIVRGLQQGDSDAWAALCDMYSVRLWRYVARLIGSNESAVADVFQETMLAVAKAGRSLSEDTRLWPWLSTIGHNQAAFYWRKQKQVVQPSVEHRVFDGVSPEETLCQQETAEAVRVLLSEMNSDYVTVLSAKYIEGLSVEKIVELLGGTSESVRSRLARARRDFRERYEVKFGERV